jgi:hypothetical protein
MVAGKTKVKVEDRAGAADGRAGEQEQVQQQEQEQCLNECSNKEGTTSGLACCWTADANDADLGPSYTD